MIHRMICCFMLSLFLFTCPVSALAENVPDQKEEISSFLKNVFEARNGLILEQNPETIKSFYATGKKSSRYAMEYEITRAKYMSTWAKKRGVKFTEAVGDTRIVRTNVQGDTAKVSLLYSLKLTYEYEGKQLKPQSFGVGTRHGITLKKVNNNWNILREWYSDPLEGDERLVADGIVQSSRQSHPAESTLQKKRTGTGKRYDREKAVAYADKYAGIAWGAGNDHRYNRKYKDYHYVGGDCTNFASQVLGDKEEGGGLPMQGGWYYRYRQGGSTAWVQTDAFKNFLLWSGYGKMIARGFLPDLLKPTSRHPEGALAELEPGDLIGYEAHGDVDHFSIVVGQDSNGYPLVDSHTGDRYHVPWDLGWDKTNKFVLIHIRD
jgi:hypothetical protein